MDFEIMNINFRVPRQVFDDDVEKAIEDYKNRYGVDVNYTNKTMSMKRSGKDMLKINFDIDNNSFSMVVEVDNINDELIFTPYKISNFGNSFYQLSYNNDSVKGSENDPAYFTQWFLASKAKTISGNIAYWYNGPHIVVDGKDKLCAGFGLIDSDGEVYSIVKAQKVLEGDTDDTFRIKTTISQWLSENRNVAAAISQIPDVADKMNYIGKYLIKERLSDKIDQDEFMDIFRQAGLFGFSDQSVLNIYKLLT